MRDQRCSFPSFMVNFICVHEMLGLATQGRGTRLEYMAKF